MVTHHRARGSAALVMLALVAISLLAHGFGGAEFRGVAWHAGASRSPRVRGADPCAGVRGSREPARETSGRLALVTGGAGFIGSSLCELLLSLGFRVRILDNLSTGDAAHVPDAAEFVNGDVRDYDAVRDATRGAHVVFHLAAMSKVEPSLSDPEMVRFCLDVNVMGTENVLRAALAEGKATSSTRANAPNAPRVVYAASSTHYGNQPTPFHESLSETLTSPYAHSKRSGEAVALLYDALHGVPATSLRLFMVYGPRQPRDGAYAIVTGTFLRAVENGEPLTIEGDGSQFRDFVHVADVARAFVLAAQTENARGAALNVGTGVGVSIGSVAEMVSPGGARASAPARAGDLRGTLADTCAAKRVLGFEARRDFGEEMRAAAEASRQRSLKQPEA